MREVIAASGASELDSTGVVQFVNTVVSRAGDRVAAPAHIAAYS